MSSTNTTIFSITLDTLKEVVKNVLMGIPTVRRWRVKQGRTSVNTQVVTQDEAERYVFLPLLTIRKVVPDLTGKTVLEIGPGDHIASGLTFLADGATHYTALDRFLGDVEAPAAQKWYQAAVDYWSTFIPEKALPPDLDFADFPQQHRDKLLLLRQPIEDFESMRGLNRHYDLVCSFLVGEHVQDIGALAKQTADLLNDGGVAVHLVDFGPHGCWRNYPDPWLFLRFPGWLWSWMSSNRGTPNRYRYHEFVEVFEMAGLTIREVSTITIQPPSVDRIARRFRSMPPDSLSVIQARFILEKTE